ncbi:MAG: hypothetical protein WAJ85_04265 [Candidatus Baltobacteraceae bacterium]
MRGDRMLLHPQEPLPLELEALLTDEERRVLAEPGVPDDVKAEIMTRLEQRRQADLEDEAAEGSPP